MKSNTAVTISIITPAYNAARFIDETVASVVAQTFGDFELLIVDDCSTDETAGRLERWAGRDSRVRLLRHEVRAGPAAARNTALEAARGRFAAFLDSDDLWLGTKLEEQLTFMRETGAAVSFHRYRRISETGALTSGTVGVPSRLDYQGLLGNTAMMTSTVLLDLGQTGPIRMRSTFYDDYACWLEVLRRGFVAHGLQRDLMRYRVVRGSWSRNKVRSAWHIFRTLRDVEGLGSVRALRCWSRYAWNGFRKYHLPWPESEPAHAAPPVGASLRTGGEAD